VRNRSHTDQDTQQEYQVSVRKEDILRIFEEAREDAVSAAESPGVDKQTAFGFGRIAGALQEIKILKDSVVALFDRDEEEERQQESRD